MRLGACAAMIKNDAAPADVTERTTHEPRSVRAPFRHVAIPHGTRGTRSDKS